MQLSGRSTHLLSLDSPDEGEAYVQAQLPLPLLQMTVVTCMETLNKNMEGERAVSMLVVGTEAGYVLIMDPSGTTVQVGEQQWHVNICHRRTT